MWQDRDIRVTKRCGDHGVFWLSNRLLLEHSWPVVEETIRHKTKLRPSIAVTHGHLMQWPELQQALLHTDKLWYWQQSSLGVCTCSTVCMHANSSAHQLINLQLSCEHGCRGSNVHSSSSTQAHTFLFLIRFGTRPPPPAEGSFTIASSPSFFTGFGIPPQELPCPGPTPLFFILAVPEFGSGNSEDTWKHRQVPGVGVVVQ